MSHFLGQITAIFVQGPKTPCLLLLHQSLIPVCQSWRYEEAALEKTAEDFSSLDCHNSEEGASHNMLAKVEKLIVHVCKSLGIVQPLPPISQCPFGYKETCKTFPVHVQEQCAVYDDSALPIQSAWLMCEMASALHYSASHAL